MSSPDDLYQKLIVTVSFNGIAGDVDAIIELFLTGFVFEFESDSVQRPIKEFLLN